MNVSSDKDVWLQKLLISSGVIAMGALSFAAQASDEPAGQSARPSCDTPRLTQDPEGIEQWLVRTMLASHCFEYQARAVSIDSIGVRTLALSHRVQDGVRQQVVQHLDGPSISVERRSQAGRLAWSQLEQAGFDIDSTPEAWAEHVEAYYDVTLENEERVAGRVASRLQFEPLDDNRYAHTWWVDEETGLLLKHELSDAQDRVVETFQMTQLQSPELYDGPLMEEGAPASEQPPWQVGWLPEGFVPQPAEITSDNPLAQRFYSDGLSSVSVFVTQADDQALEKGAYSLGVSAVAIELIESEDARWQLIGVGELPVAQVRRIVQSIELDE